MIGGGPGSAHPAPLLPDRADGVQGGRPARCTGHGRGGAPADRPSPTTCRPTSIGPPSARPTHRAGGASGDDPHQGGRQEPRTPRPAGRRLPGTSSTGGGGAAADRLLLVVAGAGARPAPPLRTGVGAKPTAPRGRSSAGGLGPEPPAPHHPETLHGPVAPRSSAAAARDRRPSRAGARSRSPRRPTPDGEGRRRTTSSGPLTPPDSRRARRHAVGRGARTSPCAAPPPCARSPSCSTWNVVAAATKDSGRRGSPERSCGSGGWSLARTAHPARLRPRSIVRDPGGATARPSVLREAPGRSLFDACRASPHFSVHERRAGRARGGGPVLRCGPDSDVRAGRSVLGDRRHVPGPLVLIRRTDRGGARDRVVGGGRGAARLAALLRAGVDEVRSAQLALRTGHVPGGARADRRSPTTRWRTPTGPRPDHRARGSASREVECPVAARIRADSGNRGRLPPGGSARSRSPMTGGGGAASA